MNKTQLKNFAIYSRNKLRQDVYSRLQMIDINSKGIKNPTDTTDNLITFSSGYILENEDIKKYRRLVDHLKEITKDKYTEALDDFVEEVAYTWFNRIIAIRFMEVNNYMPHGFKVLSSQQEGVLEPEILRNYNYLNIGLTQKELNFLDELKLKADVQAQNKMFEFLFLKQCHALNEILPDLFEKTEDFKDLLLILSFTDPQSVIYKLVNEVSIASFDIQSEDGSGQIEIIGWLYQYYNSEKKDEVIDVIKKGSIRKEDIPAATQIFTPQWIVKYMVDNSLGKYWLERNPNSIIKNDLEYLIKEGIETVNEKISPEYLTFLDNAMGSGHILVYAFDVLMNIYLSEGYMPRQAVILILENNLFGLDIDKRAYQLTYFALMMKAREYSPRVFNQNIKLNIYYYEDSDNLNTSLINNFGKTFSPKERNTIQNSISDIIILFNNATELGSIMKIEDVDLNALEKYMLDYENSDQISLENLDDLEFQKQVLNIINIVKLLQKKYDVVVTNPPYMNKFKPTLSKYINTHYADYRRDLFSVFIFRNIEMTKKKGYSAYMTPMVWMFIKTYEKLREHLVLNKHISSLIQLEYSAFAEATVPICTFVIQNTKTYSKGNYFRLSEFTGGMKIQNQKFLSAISNPSTNYFYEANQSNFNKIPGIPISYWASDRNLLNFDIGVPLHSIISPKVGLQTGNNNRFLRLWHEIDTNNFNNDTTSLEETTIQKDKWYPYNKGGSRRQWYGNYDFVVNWKNDGYEIRNFKDSNGKLRSRPQNTDFYFKEAISWNGITSGIFSIRFRESGSIHDVSGMSAFSENSMNLKYLLGILGTKISDVIFKMLNPTLSLQVGDFNNFPVIPKEEIDNDDYKNIIKLVDDNILISKTDWNLYETAWDFKSNMLLDNNYDGRIESAYIKSKEVVNNNFKQLKDNEEELNRIFIDIYGLNDELSPEVSDRDITITKIFDDKSEIDDEIRGNRYVKTREDIVKEFISYAVGCMMGRYSLDEEGLAYAGGDFNYEKYNTYKPQKDNILVISDEFGYENDIVARFIEFVSTAFGEENLEGNLEFIADSLYANGSIRDRIRRYFNNDFYKEHVQRYQKTPIYWLYDSGANKTKRQQQNAFKALVYVHRYDKNTTGNVRVRYLHEIQRAFERELSVLENELLDSTLSAKSIRENQNRIKILENKLKEIKDYDEAIAHIAIDSIEIDLDDGIAVNHQKVQTDRNGKLHNILAKIR